MAKDIEWNVWDMAMQTIDRELFCRFPSVVSHRHQISKKIFDKFIAGMLLVLSLPLAIATVASTWAVLGSPVLFSQTRVGLGTREFTIRKFRTMRDDRDANGVLLPDEQRQTPLTRIMRRIRLDELPQLVSVLFGDMAFVGPRPLLRSTIQEFGELGRMRCTVAPGLTGWAQVNGNTHLTAHQKMALDIWYIGHQSMALDAFIILLTLRTILFGEKKDPQRLSTAENYLAKISAKIAADVPES
jgi:lipopolysaccharide/colanic/teichoic acid biosynthesis glycosyltransferase